MVVGVRLPWFALVVACGCSSADTGAVVDAGTDGAPNETSVDAGEPCRAPLTETAMFDAPPLASWCSESNRGASRSTTACDGYLALLIGEGVDCSSLFLF